MLRLLALALCGVACFQVTLDFHCRTNADCHFNGAIGVCNAKSTCEFASHSPDDLAGLDFAGVVTDMAVADLASGDLAGVDFAGSDLAQSACASPQLLVTVEKIQNPAGPGKILRYSLAGGTPQACATLNGSGALGQFPEAAAKFGSSIAIAARDGVFVLDPATDQVTASWSNDPQSLFPIDVAALSTSEGAELAVAWSQTGGGPDMFELDLFLPSMASGAKHQYFANADLHVTTALGLTIDPWNSQQLMILDDKLSGTPQAEEYLEPFGATLTPHFDAPALGFSSIAAIVVGGHARIAWSGSSGVYQREEASASDNPTLVGPTSCGCTLLHAVPDPTDANRAFAVCDGTPRSVQRATHGSGCTKLVDDDLIGVDYRISHVAILP